MENCIKVNNSPIQLIHVASIAEADVVLVLIEVESSGRCSHDNYKRLIHSTRGKRAALLRLMISIDGAGANRDFSPEDKSKLGLGRAQWPTFNFRLKKLDNSIVPHTADVLSGVVHFLSE